jgi:ribonucleoside-diphosphate reductase alpha chain
MGYHTYLQNLYIPFKSEEARRINRSIFQQIKQESDKADALLVQYLGEPEWCKGYGMRATHRLSIAPTVSNSTICGNVSEGVEPIQANYWAKGSLKGVFLQKHPFTKTILQRYGLDTHSVWDSIEARDGSVQHLKELSDLEREVCLTAREIDQMEVIVQAADRQKYIDQSQSINLHYPEAKKIDLKEFSNQVFTAWKLGVKTLYYCRSLQPLKGEKAKYATRDVESNAGEVCQVCQG